MMFNVSDAPRKLIATEAIRLSLASEKLLASVKNLSHCIGKDHGQKAELKEKIP